MESTAFTSPQAGPHGARSFLGKLNGPWHKWTLQAFMIIVIAHWAEHLVQAYQVYVLKWPLHQARGVLGQAFPWLVHSEVLHYGYALIMLSAFGAVARLCGSVARMVARALVISSGITSSTRCSRVRSSRPDAVRGRRSHEHHPAVDPRLELHLFYNSVVFVPMMVAMYYHLFRAPPTPQRCGAGAPSIRTR